MSFAQPSSSARTRRSGPGRRDLLTIGFVPMIDGAVLIAAKELGVFEAYGLKVALSREVGWATIREKLLHNELDGVHAPASMGFILRCGIGTVARPCLTGFVLCLNGSAITLSRELWERGVRDAASLHELIKKDRGKRIYNFGAVLGFSSQNYQLQQWLRSGGINPEEDVRIPIIPSPMIHQGLLDGHLDGYCVAEPWNSIAVEAGVGWIAATSAQIDPGQVEKVLLVLEDFVEERAEEHLAILAALIDASLFCEQKANRPELIKILAQRQYLDVPPQLLARSLIGPVETAQGPIASEDFVTFQRNRANVPNRRKGRRIFNEVRSQPAARQCRALRPDVIPKIFREDLYECAAQISRQTLHQPVASSLNSDPRTQSIDPSVITK